jgi:long-chain acyl-CoA synthetase
MPKPVVFSHAQVLHACKSILDAYPEVESGVRLICWLPLANLFQRIINFCSIVKGGTSYVVGQPQQVMEAVAFANPQVFIAVPRFCERLHEGIMSRVRASPILARIVETSIALNAARLAADKSGLRLSRARRMTAMIADRIVLARLRYAMGRDLQFIVTGSAPMPRWLLVRLAAIGIVVLEAYGVSENLVPVAANRLRSHKLGTVGKPIGDNEVRVAADGEILVRGAGVFSPTFEMNVARSQALTDDGFLATGDLGAFDADGFLVLHGRRGEAFKDARGRWIAPSHIEAALRRVGGIEHVDVLRMRHDRLVGILSLDRTATGLRSDGFSSSSENEDRTALELLDRLADALASLPVALRPRGYLVVRAGFSIATGELTTNLKLRRQSLTTRPANPLRDLDDQLDGMSDSTSRPILRFV